MPMSLGFQARLNIALPQLLEQFEAPFHVYDYEGIVRGGLRLKEAFAGMPGGFREYYAAKALPVTAILKLLHRRLGFGFDCSSITELQMVRAIGALPEDIMFTSNNTSQREYEKALAHGGCLLNLDDMSFVNKVPDPFPRTICFRYNPGAARTGNAIIGEPVKAKYGVPREQIIEAYRRARDRGAEDFGLHTMVASNSLEGDYFVETVKMLLDLAHLIDGELGIKLKFINMGGGLGIPYRLDQQELDIEKIGWQVGKLLEDFNIRLGYVPQLMMESGRWVTGPHGVLVTKCINRMTKCADQEFPDGRTYIGVDASMSSLMRPGMYGDDCYHHITIAGNPERQLEKASVVGSICENCDRFCTDRELPRIEEGDTVLIHDVGAHGDAMTFNYNGRTRSAGVLLYPDCTFDLIKLAEVPEDLYRRDVSTPALLSHWLDGQGVCS